MALVRLALLAAILLSGVEARQRGDRPGEYRLSALSSYGRNGVEHSNNPAWWAMKPKKHMGALPLKDENQITIIFPGSRDALQLHETDKRVTKGLKMRAQSRSRSSRARSNSAMSRGRSESRGRSGSRTGSVRSGSAIVEHTNAKFAAFFEDEKSTIHDMMRVLRMVGNKKDEAPPAGFWTAKSRPASIVNRIYMDENETKIKKKKEWKILKEKLKLKWGRKSGGEDKVRSQSRSESVKTTAAKPVDGKKPAAGKGKSATKAKSKK